MGKIRKTETKDFSFTLKAMDDEAGTFTGYASIWGVVDSYGDAVMPGAFRRSLKSSGGRYPMLWSHMVDEPIGIIEAREDERGLAVVGHLNLEVQRGREVRSLMRQGAVTGLSIGYQTVVEEFDKESATRLLKEIKLWEISPVVFPALESAQVEAVKSEWDTAYVNSLPDAAFAVIEPAYKRGDTDDKRCRHLPHHKEGVSDPDDDDSVDVPHLRNALARANQIKPVTDSISASTLRERASSHLMAHAKRMGIGEAGKEGDDELERKPYPNEHSCRLRNPDDFQDNSFRRVARQHEGKEYFVIMGKLKGEDTMTEQAYRYPVSTWTVAEARSHCKAHHGISFEPAEGKCTYCGSFIEAEVFERAKDSEKSTPEAPNAGSTERLLHLLDGLKLKIEK